ncbi:TetR/AcrR family transcriptional regulator [Streptomyces sp. NPDC050355]|uniref:TetR/AcrR family transcriptional regulator n=1 Tax=Streptomyces sp. NPDC050355 TaxID=3365609 RepID=UPI0037A3F668
MDGQQERKTGMRERRSRNTKARLRDAATALAAAERPGRITVDAICAEAGVSRRTFFNHFATKDEVFLAWDQSDEDHIVQLIAARPSSESPVRAALQALAPKMSALSDHGYPDTVREVTGHDPGLHQHFNDMAEKFSAAVTLGIARRRSLPDDSYTVQLAAAYVIASLRVLARAFTSLDSPGRTQKLEETCRILEHGFLAAEQAEPPAQGTAE